MLLDNILHLSYLSEGSVDHDGRFVHYVAEFACADVLVDDEPDDIDFVAPVLGWPDPLEPDPQQVEPVMR